MTITLASQSPRRVELLRRIGVEVIVRPSHAKEELITPEVIRRVHPGIADQEVPPLVTLERTRLKAAAVPPEEGTPLALAADTTVEVSGVILDKPSDADQARHMMQLLSGRTHRVHTAVILYSGDSRRMEEVVTTEVSFAPLTEDDMQWYFQEDDWVDVAGGYRIQGRASAFITTLSGNADAVMGLPSATVYSMLKAFMAGLRR